MHVIQIVFMIANIILLFMPAVVMQVAMIAVFNILGIGEVKIFGMIILLPVILHTTAVQCIGLILTFTIVDTIAIIAVPIIELLLSVAGHVVQVPVVSVTITSILIMIFECLLNLGCVLVAMLGVAMRPSVFMEWEATVTQALTAPLTSNPRGQLCICSVMTSSVLLAVLSHVMMVSSLRR